MPVTNISTDFSQTIYVQPSGEGNDDVEINGAIAALPSTGGRIVLGLGAYTIGAPIILKSGVILDAKNATITLAAGSNCNMVKNVGDTANRSVSDANITSGQTTLTSNTALFSSKDVGASVVIPNGLSGQSLVTTIASVQSATSVTLTLAAGATVSSGVCTIYYRDSNIEVMGGIWERGGNTTGNRNGDTFVFRHIDNLSFHDLTAKCHGALSWNTVFADITNFTIRNITFNSFNISTDGIHVIGPASYGYIENIKGTTGDDMVVLGNQSDGYSIEGDISNITVNGIFPNNSLCAFKVYGDTGLKYRSIYVKNIQGTTAQSAVRIQDVYGSLDVDDLIIENVDVIPGGGTGYHLVEINASSAKHITLRNLMWRSPFAGSFASTFGIIYAYSAGVTSLTVDGLTVSNGTGLNFITLHDGAFSTLSVSRVRVPITTVTGNMVYNGAATMKYLIVNDVQALKTTNSTDSVIVNNGTIKAAHLTNVQLDAGGRLLQAASGSSALIFNAENITLNNAYELATISSTVDMNLVNVYANVSQSDLLSLVGAGAIVSVRGKGLINPNNTTAFVRDGSQTPRFVHPEMQVDLTTVAKNNGDEAYNTNATAGASTIGVGKAVSDGTHWKNVYSGNIY